MENKVTIILHLQIKSAAEYLMRRIQHNQDFVYQESPFSIPDNRRLKIESLDYAPGHDGLGRIRRAINSRQVGNVLPWLYLLIS